MREYQLYEHILSNPLREYSFQVRVTPPLGYASGLEPYEGAFVRWNTLPLYGGYQTYLVYAKDRAYSH